MTNKLLHMTLKEINIISVMKKLKNKEIWIKEASNQINKSERQIKRLKKQYILHWESWMTHKLRWKISNHKIDENKYNNALIIIKDKYLDYWPTLSAEKLAENHSIFIPIPTLRLVMINNWLWKSKPRKSNLKQFSARERKENFWEMIQYDWSYHLWFDDINWSEKQCLLVAVDDATWEVTAKFAKNEWLFETFTFWKEYIITKWKPQSIYLDKFATYKVNYPNATDDKQLPTKFWRVCELLWIKLIFANSPQAKWRVERMNKTLQNRLVKELKENNIHDIDSANKFLNEVFLPKFNVKFNKHARWNYNLHTQLSKVELDNINQIFADTYDRKIANDFTISFQNKYYQLYRNKNKSYMIKPWNIVTVEIHLNWEIHISKNWDYIDSKASFDRPERKYKLLTAPLSDDDINFQKNNIISIEKSLKFETENKDSSNLDTYYQKHKKVHPFVANCFN